MPSLPLFGSESSPVTPAASCWVPPLVRLPGRHLSSSTACWSPLSPIFKRHRSFHTPTVLLSAAAVFFEPEGLLVTTVCCRAQLLVQRPPLAPDCLLVAPTTYSTPPLPLFQPKSSLLLPLSVLSSAAAGSVPTATSRARLLAGHHCHLLSSPTARSTPPPPFFESDRSFHALTRSTTLLCAVEHRRFFRA
jgi:hypothetical protein